MYFLNGLFFIRRYIFAREVYIFEWSIFIKMCILHERCNLFYFFNEICLFERCIF